MCMHMHQLMPTWRSMLASNAGKHEHMCLEVSFLALIDGPPDRLGRRVYSLYLQT